MRINCELLIILMTVSIPLSYGIWNMDSGICHDNQYSFIQSSLWMISESILEITIVTWLVLYARVDNFVVGGLVMLLSSIYLAWLCVGLQMFCCNCLNDSDVVGTFFVLFALTSGIVIGIRNLFLIPKTESSMYNSGSHYIDMV